MSDADRRYLAAKRRLDDRALNGHVLAEFRRLLPAVPRILEVGAGLGTMVARLLEWQVIEAGEYTLLDVDRRLLDDARAWLGDWAEARGLPAEPRTDGLRLGDLQVRLVEAELGSYLDAGHGEPADVLIAHAFLDLVGVPAVLPGLFRLLVPGGAYWFTINFDGETIFQPDHRHDERLVRAYHRSMDERVRYGRPAGESLDRSPPVPASAGCRGAAAVSGRFRLGRARQTGWDIPRRRGGCSRAHHGHHRGRSLRDRVERAELADWLATRRRQIAAGELCLVADQLDFAGRSPV